MKRVTGLMCGVMICIGAGCAPTYYRVVEPGAPDRPYYTNSYKVSSGSVTFVDLRTADTVMLSSAAVRKVKAGDLPSDLKPGK
ncbi:MAG TPA: hypothetical protein VGN72_09140 [Tepidisphaeraceae bacterium]|jgi:hypothetical protein|nr:hypothetical protein [Tepidisphaeraceae bacterium]